jgi:transketolase
MVSSLSASHPAVTLEEEARELRRTIVEALFACGGGHYGGSLSVLDLILTLYRRHLRVSPAAPLDPLRDRFILSKGHSAMALYAVLQRLGFLDLPLAAYGTLGSGLEGHPDMTALPGVDFSTGSLGQGLSVGLGMALALRGLGPRVWVVLGDGECQEGQVWEAAMLAARLGLGNLTAVIDANGYQEWGWAAATAGVEAVDDAPEPVPHLARKWAAFGWRVLTVDGHDHEALSATFRLAAAGLGRPAVPTAVLAHTVKGKGLPAAEADPLRFHCTTVDPDEHARLLRSLA